MRTGGVLLPISSLSSPYGIGSLGQAAFKFVDFLKEGGQSIWQILPLSPTGYGDSPYQSFSCFAGNPYFIDLDLLASDGFLVKEDYENIKWGENPKCVDYGILYKRRFRVFEKAVKNFLLSPPEDYQIFLKKHAHWIGDYALFMALKSAYKGIPWQEWPEKLRRREKASLERARFLYQWEIQFWECLQYIFFHQWGAVKDYANQSGIEIMGDLPIYAAMDSADCWANPQVFQLNEDLEPTDVAGVPPDAFTQDGQLWGNPLFEWEALKTTGYSWWVERFAHCKNLYNTVRIDHFRGFDSYYAIPAGEKNARNGVWKQGPGMDFFRKVHDKLGEISLVAEDLGHLTPSVHDLVKDTGYPGMKVLQFAFEPYGDNFYLPHNYPYHCVVYTGTHDNHTNLGWLETAPAEEAQYAVEYLRLNKEEGYGWGMMKGVWASVAETVIIQAQDLLGLGVEARMNTPSTIEGNWQWRAAPNAFTPELGSKMKKLMWIYRRSSR